MGFCHMILLVLASTAASSPVDLMPGIDVPAALKNFPSSKRRSQNGHAGEAAA
jgi:hypothetical protein